MANKHWFSIVVLAFVTIFLDMMNYALIVPILPYLVKELNSTSFQEGILFSSYSICQLISLLIAGPLSDIYGRKLFLILSLCGSCLGSILQGLSRSMTTLIFWRSVTGLFAGSLIIVQAVIADVIPSEKRNSYLSRLDGIVSVSYIVGPAIGGVLAQISNQFPFYAAGVVSGIALIIAFIWLKESHPLLVDENGTKIRNKVEKVEKHTSEGKKTERVRPRVTALMLMCFINEFCVRWSINAFESRYGIYISDRWNVTSPVFSTLIVVQSVLNCFVQLFIYPWCVSGLNLSIPKLAIGGSLVMFLSYLGMVMSKTAFMSMTWSTILWFGFSFLSPVSVTIISATSSKEVQGTVLSWNNFCSQASMIVSPIILSTIYVYSPDGVYYFSSIMAVINMIVMSILSCRKDAKTLGKTSETSEASEASTMEEKKEGEVSNSAVTSIELAEITKTVEEGVTPDQVQDQVASTTTTVAEGEEKEGSSTVIPEGEVVVNI